MMRYIAAVLLASALLAPLSTRAGVDARMMRYPDVSASRIVFSYAGDLWVVPKEGGTALRLSSPRGEETFPRFSPDGSRIAFSGNYDGNTDVYVIPVEGGRPVRATAHGYPDRILDWTPDGQQLLVASSMASGRQRYNQFYLVSPSGGLPEKLPIPYGEMASYAPDGKKLAYTERTRAFRTWKRYRGGMAADITIFDLERMSSETIAPSDANDEFPMWHGTVIYFLSDRGPEQRANLWAYDTATRGARQLTRFAEFDIHFPCLGPGEIVFEAGGRLYLLDLAAETTREVAVTVVTDQITLLPRSEKLGGAVRSLSIAPDGSRALLEARGEIFSVPAQHGPVLNLTPSSGSAERSPAWSPDGRHAAFWSDRTGEYELTLLDLETRAVRTVTSYGPGYRYQIFWAPDSKHLAFIDQTMTIRIHDLERNRTVVVDQGQFLFHGALQGYVMSFSADSRWLAYSRELGDVVRSAIFLYDTRSEKSTQVTSGYYADSRPSFDPEGKYLYFLSNRTFNPVYSDLDNSWIYPNTTVIAAATLRPEVLSPLAPRNDTVSVSAGEEKKKEDGKKEEKKDEKKDEAKKEVAITLDGFEHRVVILPVKAGNIARVQGVEGKVLFHRMPNTGSADEKKPLSYYDLEKREEKTVLESTDFFDLSADGKKVLVGKSGTYAVVDVAENQKMEKTMPVDRMEATIDTRAEWEQIFADAWRLSRDFFYDPAMHGVDWKAMRERYGALLKDVVTRWDLNYLIGELIAELNSSHTYRGGGDTETPPGRKLGYLGVDFELGEGAYRIARIIRGAPWDSEARSALDRPGLAVTEGDYLLAVNGHQLDARRPPWEAFEGLAGQTVELTVGSRPTLEGARRILVETLEDEARLRHLAWVEQNRRRVEEASGGRIGYVYVPSTGRDGQTELVRQFVAQFTREGLIIDERFNSGGQIPDRFIELLNRKPLAYWAVRDGRAWQWPPVAHFGPKAMLVNGWSGSGGDAFPDYFRKAGLGPLIGSRTWGGLIGLSGSPALVDGGSVTVPTFRMYNPDGTWFREGHGVDPDIAVGEDPAQLARGVDVQLERAIQDVMDRLKDAPPAIPPAPPFEQR